MKKFGMRSAYFGILGTALLVTACGGGSSNKDEFNPPNINETPLAISIDNQIVVASAATEGVNGTADSGEIILGAVVDNDTTSPSVFNFASTKLIPIVKRGSPTNGNLVGGVVQSFTEECDSGNLSITIDIESPETETLVYGDSASVTANNCKDNFDGTTINGTFSINITSGSLDLNCFSNCPDVTVSVSFNNLRVTESGTTATIHGGFSMAVSETSGTAEFLGSSLYLIAGVEAIHLTDFDISSSTTGSTTSTTASLTIAATFIDGSITINTIDPILQDDFDLYPHSGTIVVTGEGGLTGATLTVIYVDSSQFDLILDTDGEGSTLPNDPVRVIWAEI